MNRTRLTVFGCFVAQLLMLPALAQTCVAPTTRQQLDISVYLAKKYHLVSTSDLTLIKQGKADDACFWKLDYAYGKKLITVYLSPDRTFLSTELYDLRIDPAVEEQKQAESVTKALLAGDPPTLGTPGSPVSIVVFSDFQCPYCQRVKNMLEQDVLPKEAGKVRVAYRFFPLAMHSWAKPAAMMAACAGLQDNAGFWKVYDFLFDNQKKLTAENLAQNVTEFVASSTTLDKKQFQTCIDKDLALGIVSKDITLGQDNGVHATPTIYVNGVKYEGMQNAPQLISIIDEIARGRHQ